MARYVSQIFWSRACILGRQGLYALRPGYFFSCNSGAHASYYMAGARMEPDAEVVLCTMRIPGSFKKEKTKHTYQMSYMFHTHHGHSEHLGAQT